MELIGHLLQYLPNQREMILPQIAPLLDSLPAFMDLGLSSPLCAPAPVSVRRCRVLCFAFDVWLVVFFVSCWFL